MKLKKFQYLILCAFFSVLIITIVLAVSVSGRNDKTRQAFSEAKKLKPIPYVTWNVKDVVVGEQNGENYRRGEVVMWHAVIHYTNGVVGSSPVIPLNLAFFLRKSGAQSCTGTAIEPATVGTTEGSDATFTGSLDAPLISGQYYLDACRVTTAGLKYTDKSGYFFVS